MSYDPFFPASFENTAKKMIVTQIMAVIRMAVNRLTSLFVHLSGAMMEKEGRWDIMTNVQKYALDAAKEIVVSKVSSNTATTNGTYGRGVAEFYETVYKKIYELASKEENI